MHHRDDLQLAHELADLAASITLRHFGADVVSTAKADGSPVTAADLEADAALVDALRTARPGDAVLSEEGGAVGSGTRRWIVDPLDGTFSFAAGGRGWGTLLALEEDGEIVLGVIDHPADRRRYWATRGGGAWAARTAAGRVDGHPRPVRVSTVARIEDARAMVWPSLDTPDEHLLRAAVSTWVEPSVDFLVDLLEGRVDVLLSQGGEVWDHAAEGVIVEEAGGRFRDPHGGRRLDLRGGTYTTAVLDTQVGALLGRW
jgi:histidinol-phosphatase